MDGFWFGLSLGFLLTLICFTSTVVTRESFISGGEKYCIEKQVGRDLIKRCYVPQEVKEKK